MRERVGVSHELLRQRTIEPVLRAQGRAHFLTDVRVVEDRAERIAWREMNQREGDRRDDRDNHYRLYESTNDVAEHPLPGWWNAIARDALVGRNPPVREVRPPRVGSHRRQLQARVIADELLRLGEPDRRRILDDRLIRLRQILAAFGHVERGHTAVDI